MKDHNYRNFKLSFIVEVSAIILLLSVMGSGYMLYWMLG